MKVRKYYYRHLQKRKENNRISMKNDNRVVCLKTGREKFLYSTFKKALRACEYSDDPQRPYYCKSCCGYHTTSETKEEYYKKLEPFLSKRYDKDVIKTSKNFKLISKKDNEQ